MTCTQLLKVSLLLKTRTTIFVPSWNDHVCIWDETPKRRVGKPLKSWYLIA